MELQPISQKEFLDKYSSGERVFSNIIMQFADISGVRFDGLKIKDSKLMFCTFWDCSFKGTCFEDCEIYFGSFYTGEISDTVFDGCKIELTLFDNIRFDRAKMRDCHIRLSGILNSNDSSVDASTSAGRLITDISQVTQQDIENSVSETLQMIERLDVGVRMKIKEMIRKDMDRYNLEHPDEKKDKRYDTGGTGGAMLTYGEVKTLTESSFGAYAQKKPYETSVKYEAKHAYRH